MRSYTLLPWSVIYVLGIAFDRLIRRNREKALHAMLLKGLAYIFGFVGILLGGGFGNLALAAGPALSPFLTIVKYPPGLAFVLLTLGINFTLLSLFHRLGPWLNSTRRTLSVCGQSPLFY